MNDERAARLVHAALSTGEAPSLVEDASRLSAWGELIERVEMHGILGVFAARLADVPSPPDSARDEVLERRLDVVRADAKKTALTLDRALRECAKRELPVMLLKGSSVTRDLYADPTWRNQGDVDLLVRSRDFASGLAAVRAAGLEMHEKQLPVWWYRLVHFHLKLHPMTALHKEIELHWRLHSPALLLGVNHDELWSRSRRIEVSGHPAYDLDPIDRYLHLVTHLLSHGRALPRERGVALVAALLRTQTPPLRLKWLADLARATEILATCTVPAEMVERARAWGAGRHLSSAAHLLVASDLCSAPANAWLAALVDAFPRFPEVPLASMGGGERPHPSLDFRLEVLRLWPRWAFPSREALGLRYGLAPTVAWLALPFHVTLVLLHSATAALALPIALLGRLFLRRSRRRARQAALEPAAVLDLVTQWRQR